MFTSFALTNVLNVECWPQILPPLHVCLSEIWKRVNKNYYVFTVQYIINWYCFLWPSFWFVSLCLFLFEYLSVFVRVSVYFCSSICLFLFEYLSVFVRVSVCFCSSICLFFFFSICLFLYEYLSVFSSICLFLFEYLSFFCCSITIVLLFIYVFCCSV